MTLAPPAATFTYDGHGLRRQTVTAAGTTNFIWDGQDVLLETDVSNNTQVTYTQTPAIYGNLVSQRRSTTTKHYHFDALGSTVALTDSNENVTDTYKYYAFGETFTSSGNTVNNLRFVGNLGYYNESALSLQYLRARYYQPATGRFASADPVFSVNLYAYADNDPVNRTDPSARFSAVWCVGFCSSFLAWGPVWLSCMDACVAAGTIDEIRKIFDKVTEARGRCKKPNTIDDCFACPASGKDFPLHCYVCCEMLQGQNYRIHDCQVWCDDVRAIRDEAKKKKKKKKRTTQCEVWWR